MLQAQHFRDVRYIFDIGQSAGSFVLPPASKASLQCRVHEKPEPLLPPPSLPPPPLALVLVEALVEALDAPPPPAPVDVVTSSSSVRVRSWQALTISAASTRPSHAVGLRIYPILVVGAGETDMANPDEGPHARVVPAGWPAGEDEPHDAEPDPGEA